MQGNGFRDRIQQFEEQGVLVFGVSTDPVAANRAFREKFDFPFPILSDIDRSMSVAFGAADGPEDAYAKRFTFVIGANGTVEQSIETKQPASQAETLLAGW